MCETSSTAMDEQMSKIQSLSFYKDKTIFITGASGFMGKVLVEKLLYSCSNLNKIYVLMRAKRGCSCDNRLEDIFKLPLFQRIRTEKPQVLKKVIPFDGDVSLDNFGLTVEQHKQLINEVNIVFHCAAILRMEAKLKNAVEINVIGTKRLLDLAKEMKHLQAFVHLSTAFCHVDLKEIDERIYDSPHDPQDIMRLVQWLDENTIDLITPKLLRSHPNTYIYSKSLAETLVSKYPNLPCCIARPSIVLPSYKEPMPGWVDNLNGPIGVIVGAGKGVIRSMHCNANCKVEVVPVDLAINALIAIAHKIATSQENSKSIPVFNITQNIISLLTYGEMLEKGKEIFYKYPFEGQVWYPDGDIRSNKYVHNIFVLFFQIIPAYLIDFLMLIFRQKRFMVRIQKRILNGLKVLQYFTTRQWIFYNKNLIALNNELSSMDKKIFPIVVDIYNTDIKEYFKHIILGTRQYCMKEDLSTLPKARRHQKMMYVIHITTVYLFYLGILRSIYNNVKIVRLFLHYLIDTIKSRL